MPAIPNASERAAPRASGRPSLRLPSRRAALAGFALALALLPFALPNSYFHELAITVALNAIVCIGLNLLIGYAGQISLGHAAFYALGGYGSALLAAHAGWPPLLAMPASVGAVGALAWLVGRPTLRFSGHTLAMGTLGLGVIVSIVLTNEDRLTGGPDGMAVPPLGFGSVALAGEHTWYVIVALALWLAVWGALNLIESPTGRALRALHGSPIAAETLGIPVARYKLRAFVLSAVFAAAAGALAAHHAGFITPAKASFLHSVELVIMVVFGGMASVGGALLGAVVLTLLPQLLTALKDYEMVAFGAVLVATMVFFPRGVVPTLARWLGERR
ncbi:branched-chain amino acid ABC transporter permease [Aquabacterium humicola]|uniref:branched-chain amino acid ABC transporter permease n=1 Tax=Aquabacterium humicola TaxID=3237377 RepID=UPI0025434226|nr:branched-chain amino acid ABC transporter permease [Rubrivivax pictus]